MRQELLAGESSWENSSGIWPLVRRVKSVRINVYFDSPTGRLQLKEDRQVFCDGRERRRQLDYSLSEKMLPEETPIQAARRGLKEELEIEELVPLTFLASRDFPITTSVSYPGLGTRYQAHVFEVILPESQFRPEGYVEASPDKKSFFLWQKT